MPEKFVPFSKSLKNRPLTSHPDLLQWIAPATVLYMAHKILLSTPSAPSNHTSTITRSKDPIYTLLKTMSFTFLPVVNVDGYAYSWDHDRLWRKNRQVVSTAKQDEGCFGIDLNRNWGYKWSEGSRPNPCSDAYPGKEPFEVSNCLLISVRITSLMIMCQLCAGARIEIPPKLHLRTQKSDRRLPRPPRFWPNEFVRFPSRLLPCPRLNQFSSRSNVPLQLFLLESFTRRGEPRRSGVRGPTSPPEREREGL